MERAAVRQDSRIPIWAGRILTGLTAIFMLLDGVMKIVKPPQVLQANVRLEYPVSALSGIGLALIACTLIYLIPRTSIVGAILLTGYLGGAVLIWYGLCLRDRRLRTLLTTSDTASVSSH